MKIEDGITDLIIHHKHTNKKRVTFEFISGRGNRVYDFDKERKDRLFYIKLSDYKKQPIIYPLFFDEQLLMLKSIIGNKILPHARDVYIRKVEKMLEGLKMVNGNGTS